MTIHMQLSSWIFAKVQAMVWILSYKLIKSMGFLSFISLINLVNGASSTTI
uniref:Uncharacterized protein n=1 Tax=Arundo donax TaxID=35708 RepID=A0A0A9E1N8_ARUDO